MSHRRFHSFLLSFKIMSAFLILAIALMALLASGYALRINISMKSIVVFGATGKTGKEAVYQSLQKGYKVIALARDPSKLQYPRGSAGDKEEKIIADPNLTVIKGSATDPASVRLVFDSASDIEGVVVALGGKPSDVGATMLTDGSRNIIYSMKQKGIKRVAIVTSIGAGDSEPQAPLAFKALMYTVMRDIFADKNNQEALFIPSGSPGHDLEWCMVRPGGLGEGPPTGQINIISGQAGSIQRSDVATFCLGAITQPDFPYIRKTPCISTVNDGSPRWTP